MPEGYQAIACGHTLRHRITVAMDDRIGLKFFTFAYRPRFS
jgi:hypothetical protein